MRNLEISAKTTLEFSSDENSKLCLADEFPISYKNGCLYQHESDDEKLLVNLESVLKTEETEKSTENCSGIVWLSDGRIAIAFHSGLLLTYDTGIETSEAVGTFPGGLQGVWKSPDDELVILASKDGAVILMTARDFEPLLEFQPDDATDAAFANVNVGWGAKETQFHGKAGKAAREIGQIVPNAVKEGEDQSMKIVWRDDGQYFAVSYVSTIDQIRRIRIFNREGQLQSTSEPVKDLGSNLAWKPMQGAQIAASLKMPNGSDVIGFFEKNGLRHGEFGLENPGKVLDISWNCNATILALHIQEKDNDKIQLWTCSNYKWQLKKSWKSGKFFSFAWDSVSPLTLFVFGRGNGQKYELRWVIDYCQEELSYVCVIDGKMAKITPFKEMIVPPPISAFELHFDFNINSVLFYGTNLAVIDENSKIHLFDTTGNGNDDAKITGAGGNGFIPKCTTLKFKTQIKFESQKELYNWNWINENWALACNGNNLICLDMKNGQISEDFFVEDNILDIVKIDENTAFLILENGSISKFCHQEILPFEEFSLPRKCSKIQATKSGFLVGLDEKSQRLYVNGKEVSTGITSFFLHSHFLMVTNVKHQLKCLPLNKMADFEKENFWICESVRSLERGSKLVVSVPFDTVTVLQMPRGNLEVIRPRALALNILKNLLDQCKYQETMQIMRRQRINLNLICDHDPDLFKKNIPKFLEQVPNEDRLCVFIADLVPENVTQSMYSSMYEKRNLDKNVDEICDLLLENMQKNKAKFILPIISCHVKNSKSKVENALLEIKKLKDDQEENLANSALNFLLLLVNVNQLFDVALGLYDFDLVLFVAEKSQKDPKEFLPFMNELKKLEDENYRKYRIDLHLKRYKSALNNISKCLEEKYSEECLNLVKNQRLYLEAMELFPPNSALFSQLCQIYGDYLMSKKYYEDAALIFESGNLKIEAISAWEHAGNWSLCLALARENLKIPAEFSNLARKMADKLKETNRHKEASEILIQYLNDPEEAIVALIEGQKWEESYNLIQFHQRLDLYETNLKPALIENSDETLANLDRKIEKFTLNLKRFKEVVAMKEKLAEGNFEETDINIEDVDMYSDVTSLAGTGSQISKIKSNPGSIKTKVSNRTKSSRSRKKQEMKKYSTKEGSKYEDLGLMAEFHDLISSIFKSTFVEIGAILRILVKFAFKSKAKEIQSKALELSELISQCINVIWDPKWINSSEQEVKFGPDATTEEVINRSANQNSTYKPELYILEAKYRIPPQKPANSNDWILQILK